MRGASFYFGSSASGSLLRLCCSPSSICWCCDWKRGERSGHYAKNWKRLASNRQDRHQRINRQVKDGWRTREEMEAAERTTLAPFAQKAGESRGRKYPEQSHAFRIEFQHDRARIIHSRSFRRLEYKTQVFLNGTGDHLRTRLTHSIEVASISRTIARALALNEDLAEAIALAHDLGHSPFGHSGEEMLAECMREHGGFEHNSQSLRVVELLENPYPKFPGLNLTLEVREGLQKNQVSSLEAQIADLADEITYYSHDLDDAIDFDILNLAQLEEVDVWKVAADSVRARYLHLREPDLHT